MVNQQILFFKIKKMDMFVHRLKSHRNVLQVITMRIINAFDAPEMKNPHKVSARKLMDFKHALVVMLDIKPNESLLPHITPVDVFFYILEGKGEVKIGEEIKQVKKDDIIFSPAKIVHLLRNSYEEGNFRVLVVKTPKPTSETKLL